ncbi:MAG: FAD-binding oxidoreductase [Rhodobacteraceae bacterium]|nr:FAD-binding oxidoreductase [Paracoccaceae bacterium]
MLNPVTDAFEAELRCELSDAAFRDIAPHYLEEPRGKYPGQAGLVLAPGSVEEVSVILKAANAARVGVVPYGGGTGLVAGQVATHGPAPVILSLERRRAIRDVHAAENVLVAEAGATLAEVQATAEEAGRLFPLSYASEGTARIGGALAVNSGGLAVLRYGTARDLCLGLEAVLPNGQIWHGLRRLRKDNTGYDLRNLLIGAEGTLGVITAAALRLYPRPAARATAMIAVPHPAAALALFARAEAMLGDTVSAFELIAGQGLSFLREAGFDLRQPFDVAPDWSVLIETGVAPGIDADAALERVFAEALEAGEATDGVIARSEGQRRDLWALRETIPAANKRLGAIASHDVSLPLGELPGFIEAGSHAVAGLDRSIRVNAFGHLGDGNLHYNLFPQPGGAASDYAHLVPKATRIIHDLVARHDGSFSAEHGVGRLKVGELERYGDPAKLAAMRAIKTALDPNGIMNPGAVLRAE